MGTPRHDWAISVRDEAPSAIVSSTFRDAAVAPIAMTIEVSPRNRVSGFEHVDAFAQLEFVR